MTRQISTRQVPVPVSIRPGPATRTSPTTRTHAVSSPAPPRAVIRAAAEDPPQPPSDTDEPDLLDDADLLDDLGDPDLDDLDDVDGPDGSEEPPWLDGCADPAADLTLGRPAELAAAVPVLLGFHPQDSLVVVSIGGSAGNRVGLTVRVDLPSSSASAVELSALRAAVVDSLLRDRPRGAAVLVFAAADDPGPPHRRLVDALAGDLEENGVRVLSALWAESTAAGARWACYDSCGCRGTLPDPASTAIAAAGVLDGRVVHGSRTELSRLVEPVDPARLERREELLAIPAAVLDEPAAGSGGAGPARRAPVAEYELLRAAARTLDEAVADAAAGRLLLDDARVVALARALAVPAVRDEAMRRSIGRGAPAAEDLWLALVRETPDPEAAEPAALLAISALQRGDGVLANVALDRAERAWPGHRLTRTLRDVAAAGLPPSDVRDLLRSSLAGRPRPAGALRPAGGSARTARRRRPSS